MENEKGYIEINTVIRKAIRAKLGVSYLSISKALNFERNTDLSEKIREMAIELGGIEYKLTKVES